MRKSLLIGLLLYSITLLGADLEQVKGELRLLLPKRHGLAQVTLVLKEINAGLSEHTLALQTNVLKSGALKVFELKYSPPVNRESKRYSVDIVVREIAGNKVLAEASFPLQSLDQPDELNILIQVPAEPIE